MIWLPNSKHLNTALQLQYKEAPRCVIKAIKIQAPENFNACCDKLWDITYFGCEITPEIVRVERSASVAIK